MLVRFGIVPHRLRLLVLTHERSEWVSQRACQGRLCGSYTGRGGGQTPGPELWDRGGRPGPERCGGAGNGPKRFRSRRLRTPSPEPTTHRPQRTAAHGTFAPRGKVASGLPCAGCATAARPDDAPTQGNDREGSRGRDDWPVAVAYDVTPLTHEDHSRGQAGTAFGELARNFPYAHSFHGLQPTMSSSQRTSLPKPAAGGRTALGLVRDDAKPKSCGSATLTTTEKRPAGNLTPRRSLRSDQVVGPLSTQMSFTEDRCRSRGRGWCHLARTSCRTHRSGYRWWC